MRPITSSPPSSFVTVFLAFMRLGLTSFGGPVAHLGYFRAEFVARRKWLDEAAYADIVALCQFLPGPGEQPGRRCRSASCAPGLPGGIGRLARLHPAVGAGDDRVRLRASARSATSARRRGCTASRSSPSRWWRRRCGAWRATLCPDRDARHPGDRALRSSRSHGPPPRGQIAAIVARRRDRLAPASGPGRDRSGADRHPHRARACGSLRSSLFVVLLFGLPLLAAATANHAAGAVRAASTARAHWCSAAAMSCCRCCRQSVVPPGWIGNDAFLAGYGAAQAVPGPLFTFAAYLGAVMEPAPNGWLGGLAVPGRDLPARPSCC